MHLHAGPVQRGRGHVRARAVAAVGDEGDDGDRDGDGAVAVDETDDPVDDRGDLTACVRSSALVVKEKEDNKGFSGVKELFAAPQSMTPSFSEPPRREGGKASSQFQAHSWLKKGHSKKEKRPFVCSASDAQEERERERE